MKFIYSAFFLSIFFFSACTKEMRERVTPAEQQKQVIYSLFTAFDNGDISGLDTLIHEDIIEHHLDTNSTDKRGLEAIKEMYTLSHNSFSEKKTKIHSIAVNGDTVFTMSEFTAKHTSDFMGMPATNEKITSVTTDVFVFSEGKVKEHWSFVNPADVMKWIQSLPQE